MVDLNLNQIKKIFNLANLEMPSAIDENLLTKALIEIEKKISPVESIKNNADLTDAPSILIVDDLELSIHQLSLLLDKSGYNACVARTVVEATDMFKKRNYEYVLLDLFIPDPEDGLKLLTDLINFNKTKENATKIIIISGTDDKKLISECFLKGANEFIEKGYDWHNSILKYISHLEKLKKGGNEEIISKIEDEEYKIASISIINLHKDAVIQELSKEITYLLNLGYSNIVIDLENLYSINSKGISALIASYKNISKNGGQLVLSSVKDSVNELLSYVYLHNVLKLHKDKDNAINSLKTKVVK